MSDTVRVPYLSSLTALRGIAAIVVVIYHFSKIVLDDELLPAAQSSFVQKGYLMVDFFFILSGFIMAYVYGAQFEEKWNSTTFKPFLRARFARLYPLHLFTLGWCLLLKAALTLSGAMALLSADFQAVYNLKVLPAHLLLLNAFVPQAFLAFNVPSWSISAEWYTYLLFPLLVWVFARIGWGWKSVLVVLLYLAYWGIIQLSGRNQDLNIVIGGGILRCLVGFCIGMVVYAGFLRIRMTDYLRHSGWFVVAGLLTLAGMHFGVSDIFLTALFPALLLFAAMNTGALARCLDYPFFQKIGTWSYSIYMVHVPLMSTFLTVWLMLNSHETKNISNASALAPTPVIAWSACAAYLLIVLGLSALTYRFIEAPLRRWINP